MPLKLILKEELDLFDCFIQHIIVVRSFKNRGQIRLQFDLLCLVFNLNLSLVKDLLAINGLFILVINNRMDEIG